MVIALYYLLNSPESIRSLTFANYLILLTKYRPEVSQINYPDGSLYDRSNAVPALDNGKTPFNAANVQSRSPTDRKKDRFKE